MKRLDETIMSETGKRLWNFLKNEPASVRELAQQIGIARQTLVRILFSEKEPNLESQLKIKKFLEKRGY